MPAGEIETAVIDQLRGLLRAPEIVVRTWRAARQSIGDIKEADIRELQDAIEGFKGRGIGSFILGLLNLVVGLLLLTSPVSAALMVPLVFGVLLLIEGVAHIFWAFRVRPQGDETCT